MRDSSTTFITGSFATFLSVYTPIFALARSEAGSWASILAKSIPTSEVAPSPKRRFEAAIYEFQALAYGGSLEIPLKA
jgi:hypothetical protein